MALFIRSDKHEGKTLEAKCGGFLAVSPEGKSEELQIVPQASVEIFFTMMKTSFDLNLILNSST